MGGGIKEVWKSRWEGGVKKIMPSVVGWWIFSEITHFVYLDAGYYELKMVSGSGLPSLTKIKKERKRNRDQDNSHSEFN